MPLFLLLFVPAAFALNPVIARALAADVEPGTLSFVRWGLSAALIGAVALARGRRERWRIADRDAAILIVLGALGFGFCSFAAYAGVRTTTATNVGLIYACTSAFVMLIELARGRIRASALLTIGVVACVAGVIVLITKGEPTRLAAFTFGVGEGWALAGTLVWALYTAAMSGRATGMTAFAQFTLMSVAGALAMLVPTVFEIANNGPPRVDSATVWWVLALVIIPSCGAFIGYNASITLNGSVLCAASLSLVPPAVAGMAVVLINEQLGSFHALAIALVVAGLAAINLDRSRATRMPSPLARPAQPVRSAPLHNPGKPR